MTNVARARLIRLILEEEFDATALPWPTGDTHDSILARVNELAAEIADEAAKAPKLDPELLLAEMVKRFPWLGKGLAIDFYDECQKLANWHHSVQAAAQARLTLRAREKRAQKQTPEPKPEPTEGGYTLVLDPETVKAMRAMAGFPPAPVRSGSAFIAECDAADRAKQQHAFVGSLDRWCEVCNQPDRAEIHREWRESLPKAEAVRKCASTPDRSGPGPQGVGGQHCHLEEGHVGDHSDGACTWPKNSGGFLRE